MKKLIFVFMLFTLGIIPALPGQVNDLKNQAKNAAEEAKEAAEEISDLCSQNPPDASAIFDALAKAKAAVATAEAALEELPDDADRGTVPRPSEVIQEAIDEAKEAYESAQELGGGAELANKIISYCDKQMAEHEEVANEDICDGERGTLRNLLDAVKKNATTYATAHPCDSAQVRTEMEDYITNRYQNTICDKLKEWIDKLFSLYVTDRGERFFPPEDELIKAENYYFSFQGGPAWASKPGRGAFPADMIDQISRGLYEDPQRLEQMLEQFQGELFIGTFSSPGRLEDIRLLTGAQGRMGIHYEVVNKLYIGLLYSYQKNQLQAQFPATVIPFSGTSTQTIRGELQADIITQSVGLSSSYLFGKGKLRPRAGLILQRQWEKRKPMQANIEGVILPVGEAASQAYFSAALSTGFELQISPQVSATMDVEYRKPISSDSYSGQTVSALVGLSWQPHH